MNLAFLWGETRLPEGDLAPLCDLAQDNTQASAAVGMLAALGDQSVDEDLHVGDALELHRERALYLLKKCFHARQARALVFWGRRSIPSSEPNDGNVPFLDGGWTLDFAIALPRQKMRASRAGSGASDGGSQVSV